MVERASRRASEAARGAKKCTYCPRVFTKADHLDRHLRSHTKEKPFSCTECDRSYPRHDSMLRHMRMHHGGRKAPEEEHRTSFRADDATMAIDHTRFHPIPPDYRDDNSNPIDIDEPSHIDLGAAHFDIQVPRSSLAPAQYGYGSDLPADTSQQTAPSHQDYQTPAVEAAHVSNAQPSLPASFFKDHPPGLESWCDFPSFLMQDDYALEEFLSGMPGNHCDNGQTEAVVTGSFTDPLTQNTQAHAQRTIRKIPDLRRYWPTQVYGIGGTLDFCSRGASPAKNEESRDKIDENYRANAATRLVGFDRAEPLPPLGLLNLFIQLFFTKFNAVLPLIHAPTFRPNKQNALLVLSICSAGSLFFGCKDATNAGSMLFERVNKAHLNAPWEKSLFKNHSQAVLVLKAALIGQTFALLSGNPAHLDTMVAFHGTVLSLARRLKLFDKQLDQYIEPDLSGSELHGAWKKWARNEECRRLTACLHLHDAEVAALFHHEPLLRHKVSRSPRTSSDGLFNAPTAEMWYCELKKERGTQCSGVRGPTAPTHFSRPFLDPSSSRRSAMTMIEAYTTLTGIGAAISEQRRFDSIDFNAEDKYQADLLTWLDNLELSSASWGLPEQQTMQLVFNLLALWHATWLSLFVDLDKLESSIGRDGPDAPIEAVEYAESWIADQRVLRCLLHALLLHDYTERLPIGSVLLPSLPRALFSAVIVWQAYLTYRPDAAAGESFSQSWPASTEYLRSLPEVQKVTSTTENEVVWSATARATLSSEWVYGKITRLHDILGSVLTGIKQRTLYMLADTLRRSSTYGVAKRMANVTEIMLSFHPENRDDT